MSIANWEFEFLRSLVKREIGFVLEPDNIATIEHRLDMFVRSENLGQVSRLVRELRMATDTAFMSRFVDQITNHETLFFRDPYFFDSLRTHVIPNLIKQRKEERTLELWSAACSSGQEAYSLAIVLREHFPELEHWNVRILATDVSQEMVERTRSGLYTEAEIGRGLAPELKRRYFDETRDGFRAVPRLRDLITTRQQNLVGTWAHTPSLDLALLRNVLIYFDVETKQRVLREFRRVLRPTGYLAMGGGESTFQLDPNYAKVQFGRSVFYQAYADATTARAASRKRAIAE